MATAQPGIISYALVPNPLPDGWHQAAVAALVTAGFPTFCTRSPNGIETADAPTVLAVLSNFVGSAAELTYHRERKQKELDAHFDETHDFHHIVRSGHGAMTPQHFSEIANNYRALRNQIAIAEKIEDIAAIDVKSGWPANQ
jgi:hypothetical protein